MASALTARRAGEAVRPEREVAGMVSDALYRQTLQALDTPVFAVDSALRLSYCNDSFRTWVRNFGFHEEPVGNELRRVLPFLPPTAELEYETMFRGGAGLSTEEVLCAGSTTLVSQTRRLPVVENGQTVAVVTLMRDVTAERQISVAAQASEARLLAIANAADVAVGRWLPDTTLVAANQAFCQAAGWRREDSRGRSFLDAIPDGERAKAREVCDAVVREHTVGRHVVENAGPDGEARWQSWVHTPVIDANGTLVEVLSVGRDVPHEHQVAQAMRLKEQAIDSASNGIAFLDAGSKLTFANASLAKMWGVTGHAELLGLPAVELFVSREVFLAMLDAVHQRGKCVGEMVARSRDGSTFGVEVSASLIAGEPGEESGIMLSVLDVSELVLMQDALLASEATLGALFDPNPDSVYLLKPDGRVLLANAAAARALGRRLGEIIGRKVGALLPSGAAELVVAHLQAATQSARQVQLETTTGGRTTEHRICPIIDSTGAVETLTWFARDITETRAAQRATLDANQMMQALIDASPLAIVTVDRAGSVATWSAAAKHLFELGEGDVVGTALVSHPNATLAELGDRLGQVLNGGRGGAIELAFQRGDGVRLDLLAHLAPVYDSQGRMAGAMAIVADQTERKRMQEELIERQKMDAMGRLADGVAHDLNDLLQAMLSLAEVVRTRRHEEDRVLAAATVLEERSRAGAALTRQLLLFSGSQLPVMRPLDLNVVVSEVRRTFRTLLRGNIAISVELADVELPVRGDRTELEQMLVNLAARAGEAMPHGGQLVVRTALVGDSVLIEVSDTGPTISPVQRASLFEPFTVAARLGLAVVHRIVTRHGGRIAVETPVKGGVTFRITLPRSAALAPATTAEPATEVALGGRGQGERVLLVEDEPGTREGLAEVLTMLGYATVAVASGEQAIALPAEPAFHVLLTDLMLGGVGGAAVARALHDRWPRMAVIVMSGYSVEEVGRHGVSEAWLRFLPKPFDMGTLAGTLRAALGAVETAP
jgi:two-component system, cell cycle sensor histidine kinase and response regulator CckA